MINDMSQGGAQQVFSRMLYAMEDKKDNVIVLLLDNRNMLHKIPKGYEVIHLHSIFGKLALPFILKRLVRARSISTVFSQLYLSNFINILARFLGSPHRSIVMNQGIASRLYKSGAKGRLNLYLQKYLYPGADRVICVSRAMSTDLLGIAPKIRKIAIIPNAFDTERLEQDALEGAKKFQRPEFYVISLARLIPLKNHHHSIQAAAMLKIDFIMEIYGEGEERERLENLVKDCKLEHRVRFPGYIHNPMPLLATADVLLLLSKSEALPTVIIEAMIVGTLVIASDCPFGPREILTRQKPASEPHLSLSENTPHLREGMEITPYGILVAVGDVKAVCEAITWVHDNPGKVVCIREEARKRAWEWDMKNIIPMYRNLLFTENHPVSEIFPPQQNHFPGRQLS